MDKYEYKARSEEIFKLIDEEKYAEAVTIADAIDWRRVKSITVLLKIAALYRVNRRNEDGRELLLLAYERHPTNRSVVYSLCEISIELDDVVAAIEYYKQFVKLAPRDNGVFTLRYRILEAQEASLEERIQLLEELKKRDYQEEWAYELAYLYHRVGLATKCVEECDDLILWFGEGSYVMKAMELKMLHAPLTEVQQMKYAEMLNHVNGDGNGGESNYADDDYHEEPYDTETAYSNETYADGNYADDGYTSDDYENYNNGGFTGNTEEFYVEHTYKEEPYSAEDTQAGYFDEYAGQGYPEETYPEEGYINDGYSQENYINEGYPQENYAEESYPNESYPDEGYSNENYPQQSYGNEAYPDAYSSEAYSNGAAYADDENRSAVSTPASVDMSQYNTINLQKVVAESMRELFLNNDEKETLADNDLPNAAEADSDSDLYAQTQVVAEKDFEKIQEAIDPEPKADDDVDSGLTEWAEEHLDEDEDVLPENDTTDSADERSRVPDTEEKPIEMESDPMHTGKVASMVTGVSETEPEPHTGAISKVILPGSDARFIKEDTDIDELRETTESSVAEELSQLEDHDENEYREQVEKPITGQLNLDDVLAEWERMKLKNAQKHQEEVRQQVLSQTGKIFKEFDDSIKEDILGELDEPAEAVDEIEKPVAHERSLVYDTQNIEPVEEVYEQPPVERDTLQEKPVNHKTELDPDKAEMIAEMAREDAIHTQEIKMSTAELSSLSDKILAATKKEAKGAKREEIREFSPEEQKLFENFAVTKKIKKQIIYALDHMTLTAHTGNVIITGDAGLDTVRMAKNLVHKFQETDNNFSGKAAKITGEKINQRSLKEIFDKLENGAIIIEKANGMTEEKLYEMTTLLNQKDIGIIIIIEDTGKEIAKLLKKQAMIADYFNIRVDLIEMDNNALVAYAKNYALALEYSIDELGTLALYTRISNIQSGNHVVTKDEVRDIIDEAIWRSKRSKIKNFVDVLFSKRYDSEDMIVLKERDFM